MADAPVQITLTAQEFDDLKAIVSHYQPKAHTVQFANRPALSETQRAPYVRRVALRDRILDMQGAEGLR